MQRVVPLRRGHDVPVRGAEVRVVPGADAGEVREDDPRHDLGVRHQRQGPTTQLSQIRKKQHTSLHHNTHSPALIAHTPPSTI